LREGIKITSSAFRALERAKNLMMMTLLLLLNKEKKIRANKKTRSMD
jgi:hypothetical protein